MVVKMYLMNFPLIILNWFPIFLLINHCIVKIMFQDIIFSLIGPDLVTKFVTAITIKLKKVDWFKLVAALKAT